MEIKQSDYKCEGKEKWTFTEKSSEDKKFLLLANYWTNCLLSLGLVVGRAPLDITITGNTTKYKHTHFH